MNSSGQQSLFPETIYDYLFVLEPDEVTSAAVKRLKQLLHDRIVLSWGNLTAKPHLSLFEIRRAESAEESMLVKIRNMLDNRNAFDIELDGLLVFEHGKESRSMVLKLADPKPVKSLQAALRKELRLKAEKWTPHVTIARNIPLSNFRLLESTEEFDFMGVFAGRTISILRKPANQTGAYKVIFAHKLSEAVSHESKLL